MSRVQKLFAVGVFFAFFCGTAFAQGGATGAITGTVQDPSGGVIAGAKVEIVNNATGEIVRTVVTDPAGTFIAQLLPVGTYTAQISASGFASAKVTGIGVNITETTRIIVPMKVSGVASQVEVVGAIEELNTTAPTTGQVLNNTTITELPLATRNFQQLLALSVGASSDLNNPSDLGRGQTFIHVNGGRDDNNNYLIEGITVSDYAVGQLTNTPVPNPDAIQEFKVSTSLYDATQGRNGGGNINATLKSGTSSYHGAGWEYFRNTVLDANDWFLKAAGEPRPVIQQNIFGGDFGGPVPAKNLGFFYVNYQGTRQRSGDAPGTIISTLLPILPQQRDQTTLINDLFNGPNCPGLPAGVVNLDPVSLKLLQFKSNQFGGAGGGFLIPSLPGTPGCINGPGQATVLATAPFVFSTPGKYRDDQAVATWDKDFNHTKDRVAFRFFWSDSDKFEPFGGDSFGIQTGGLPTENNLNFPLDIPLRGRFGSLTETHLFTSNLINEFRFGINITNTEFNNSPIVTANELGINRPTNNGTPDIYRFQLVDFSIGPYPTQLQQALTDSFIWLDTLSWTHGAHTLRLGGEVDRNTIRRTLPVADNGLLLISPSPGANGLTQFTDFQNLLLGALGTSGLADGSGGVGNHDYRIPAASLFGQDDYRIRPDLTLNLGMRVEFVGAPYDDFCHIGNTDPLLAQTGQPFFWPTCVNQFNVPGVVGTQSRTDTSNTYSTVWEPRIGFAYDLLGRHTTTIRAGYGIYSVREDLGAVDNMSFSPPFLPTGVAENTPPGSFPNLFVVDAPIPPLGVLSPAFAPVPSFLQGFTPGCTLANGTVVPPGGDISQCTPIISGNVPFFFGLAVQRKWIVPTTQQWNLTVQHTIGRDWFVEVGYVGTKGTHLRGTSDPDEALPASVAHPITVTTQGGQVFQITTNTVENAPARAPFLPLAPGAYEAFLPNSDSHYNALQLTVAHHFAHGLYFQSGYTYANSIDDTSTATVAFDTRFNDQLNPRDSRGLSDFFRRHRWVTSFVYQLPFFEHSTGIVHGALGGWETSGVFTLQSGAPFTPIDSAGGGAYQFSSPGLATPTFAPGFSCANATTSGGTEARINGLLNRNAFVADGLAGPGSDATTIGNVPRNCFIGPPQGNIDFTIAKNFRITERQTLRFRTDFFNFTNHPSFAVPTILDYEAGSTAPQGSPLNLTAPLTGVVGTPRVIQFSLKYSF
ncbi:MAG TPA: carboxypeptidase-like regulatory domain-containing protein [Candidatus Sulfotelmatobacter sp.]|nr:carboxypeptidase-like regulatory domain-containing protein [Candidatus Sulfotelmatobacter sp.]